MIEQPTWVKPDLDAPVIDVEDPSIVKMRRVDTPFIIVCDRGHFRQIKTPESSEELKAWIQRHAGCQDVTSRRSLLATWLTATYAVILFTAWWLVDSRVGNASHSNAFVTQLEGVGIWVAIFAIYGFGRRLIQVLRKKWKR